MNLVGEVFKSIKTNISNTIMHLDEYYNIGKAIRNNQVAEVNSNNIEHLYL